jgi:hypothetical protein
MKQTAVEWLYDQLEFDDSISMDDIEKIFEHAKEMEKEQIIDAVVNTVKIGTEKEGVLLFTSEDEILIKKEAEQYYNETFKSE